MGFASKLSMNVFSKDGADDDTVLASPDTQFGAGMLPQPPAADGAASQHGSADAAARRLGSTRQHRPQQGALDAAGEGDELRLPLIGHLSLSRQLRLVLAAFVAGILLTVLSMWQNAARTDVVSSQGQIASDALMHAQRVAKAAPNALRGEMGAFNARDESRAEVGRLLQLLARGGQADGNAIPASSGELQSLLAKARSAWVASNAAATTIVGNKRHLVGFGASVDKFEPLALELQSIAGKQPAVALDDTLRDIGTRYGSSTVNLVAMQLEYPR